MLRVDFVRFVAAAGMSAKEEYLWSQFGCIDPMLLAGERWPVCVFPRSTGQRAIMFDQFMIGMEGSIGCATFARKTWTEQLAVFELRTLQLIH
ncbi:MAG: hypothetical protein WC732_08820 [Candidatus Omnitrophota bacterium]